MPVKKTEPEIVELVEGVATPATPEAAPAPTEPTAEAPTATPAAASPGETTETTEATETTEPTEPVLIECVTLHGRLTHEGKDYQPHEPVWLPVDLARGLIEAGHVQRKE